MGFKDIFDSDRRSKEDLRKEIASRDMQLENLRKALSDLEDSVDARLNISVLKAVSDERKRFEAEIVSLQAEVGVKQARIERQSNVISNLRAHQQKIVQRYVLNLEAQDQINRKLKATIQDERNANALELYMETAEELISSAADLSASGQESDRSTQNPDRYKSSTVSPADSFDPIDIDKQSRPVIRLPKRVGGPPSSKPPKIQVNTVEDTEQQEQGRGQTNDLQDFNTDRVRQLQRALDAAQVELGLMRKGLSKEVWNLQTNLEHEQKRRTEVEFECRNLKLRLKRLEGVDKMNVELKRESVRLRENSITHAEHEKVRKQLTAQNERRRDEIEGLRYLLSKAERELRLANQNVENLQRHVAEMRGRPAALSRSNSETVFSHPLVIRWLLHDSNPENAGVPNGWVSQLGNGPWSEQLFVDVISEQGFVFWRIPDSDIRHLVVGRNGWTKGELLSQIDAVEDENIRIYSQEMFLAKLITGRDPFDASNDELLFAFAQDHPALAFLIGLSQPWPEICINGDNSVHQIDGDDFGVKASPLSLMGYHVGASSSLTAQERHRILDDCFKRSTLEFSVESSDEYRNKWGRARSAQRLYRMAVHIKWLVDTQGKDGRKVVARDEWVRDLTWLRKSYYEKVKHRFKWP